MEVVQMYNDVPAIELGADDSSRNLMPYVLSPIYNQSWSSMDPVLNTGRSSDQHQAEGHSVGLEQQLVDLGNPAHTYRDSTAFHFPRYDSPKTFSSPMWSTGIQAPRPVRYMSPNGSWGGSLCSTNSAASDPGLSPSMGRSQPNFFPDELDLPASLAVHYQLPLSPGQRTYASHDSGCGSLEASPPPIEHTMVGTMEQLPYAADLENMGTYEAANGSINFNLTNHPLACTMKELQYTPDLANDEPQEMADDMAIDLAEVDNTSPTSECWGMTTHAPRFSDCGRSMEDVADQASTDRDTTAAHPSSNSRDQRKLSRRRNVTSPTLSQDLILKSQNDDCRVVKSCSRHALGSKNKTKNSTRRQASTKKGEARPFFCAFYHYGCGSRFTSKNEWKRHVASKHLQLGFYRCDTGQCQPDGDNNNPRYNDFNRKDLFTQHHRRMHTPWGPSGEPPSEKAGDEFEQGLDQVRIRCWKESRKPPTKSQCIFCHWRSEGDGAWEDRMEHIGKHFEREDDGLGPGREDMELRWWALEEGLIVSDGGTGRYRLQELRVARHANVGHHRRRRSPMRRRPSRAAPVVVDVEQDAVGENE